MFAGTGSSLLHGLSLVAASGGYSCCMGLLQWLFLLQSAGLMPCGMWHLSGPGITLLSPALTARFLTTGPPGKPKRQVLTEYLATQIVCIVLLRAKGMHIKAELNFKWY
ncbi:unnamed protein product [Rangifer tarandus platyrhynchus]|uniref:Uncharacterized protein n=1 Tax=Rangifer tarandus platyrhynchus TaxID=3082113 RepID=A0AC59YGS1_RANTA